MTMSTTARDATIGETTSRAREALAGGILDAAIFHKRFRPHPHAFAYRIAALCVPLSRLAALDRRAIRLDRWGPFSFQRAAHGARDGSDLAAWMRGVLDEHGLSAACDGEIVLQTLPRQFGYVFNPVSFWFCLDRAGKPRAVLCAVTNTFGERHDYLVARPDHAPIAPDEWLTARKVFHVSPFMPVAGEYRFRFAFGEDAVRVDIHYFDAEGLALTTSIAGRRAALDDRALLRRLVAHPLLTLGVILRIHWQAFHLWRKGARFHRKPAPPTETLSR